MKTNQSLYSNLLIFCILAIGIQYLVSCEKEAEKPTTNNKLELSTPIPTSISHNQIDISASINDIDNNLVNITDHGFCWATTSNPDIGDSVERLGSITQADSFSISILNLLPNTQYFIRAYATLTGGTIYGQEVSIKTLKTGKPNILSDSIFMITCNSAYYSGTILSDSGFNVTSKGFCWGLEPMPDLSDSSKINFESNNHFTTQINTLNYATTYYVRAFAINAAGTSYGNELSFKTNASLPVIITEPVKNITKSSALSGGNITSDGGSLIIMRGLCWSTSPNPTTANSYYSSGIGTGTFSILMDGLNSSTTYYARAFATNSAGTAYGGQITFTTPANSALPIVTTTATTDITQTTASSGGNVTSDGGATVSVRGVCWSTSPNPTTANSYYSSGSGTGAYSIVMNGLNSSTTYYVRAFATNSVGTAYGSQVTFKTLALIPTVTTTSVSGISTNSASSGGNVTNSGGATVTMRGVCWSTSPNPTTANSFHSSGNGTGAYSIVMDGLNPSTTYYARAFATNSGGTAYGNQVVFTTLATKPTVTTTAVSGITVNSASSGGNVTNSGGATVTMRGVCWSTSQNPTTANSYHSSGTGTGAYSILMDGLNSGTTYYARAFATNSGGTAYGSQVTFKTLAIKPTVTTTAVSSITINSAKSGGNVTNSGGAPVTMRGVCWSTSPNPTTANSYHSSGTGTGAYSILMDGLNSGTTYYARAFATNSGGTAYGAQVTFKTLTNIVLPAVSTAATTNITQTTATSGGNVTSDGGTSVTARGVCWSTNQYPTISGSHTSNGTGTGSFTSSLSGLNPGKIYYVRAYATNSKGTAYGSQLTFTTLSSCVSFTLNHIAGGVAPVTKAITYGTVSTNLSGSTKCWITQNLGATRQATSATDDTEESAGWYWQFNKKQGYKHDGTTRTPNTTWITSINENSDWLPTNDPCALLLGSGWRIPTKTEWETADATGAWNNYYDTYTSILKLHTAGGLQASGGWLFFRGSSGLQWSSTQVSSSTGWYLDFVSGSSVVGNTRKHMGSPCAASETKDELLVFLITALRSKN